MVLRTCAAFVGVSLGGAFSRLQSVLVVWVACASTGLVGCVLFGLAFVGVIKPTLWRARVVGRDI